MKNKKLKRKRSNKKLIVVISMLALVAVGGLYYLTFIKEDPVSVNQEEQNSAAQAEVDAAKQRIEEESQDEPLKDDGEEEAPVSSGPVSLTDLTYSQASGLVNSSVTVSGAESGTCTFVFTDGDGRAISKTAKLSSGSCSISVSEAEFTMIGEYNLSAKFGDKSISKTITIN